MQRQDPPEFNNAVCMLTAIPVTYVLISNHMLTCKHAATLPHRI